MVVYKLYKYNKQNVQFDVLSLGVSRTKILSFMATIPVKYFDGIDRLYFMKVSKEELLEVVYRQHHYWEKDLNRSYHAFIYEDNDGKINIAVYISNEFYREAKPGSVWTSSIRRALLHELGHHLLHKRGLDDIYDEKKVEELVDRFSERHSDMRVLMLVSQKKKHEYDKIWDEIENKKRRG